jgi:hypothetical protein
MKATLVVALVLVLLVLALPATADVETADNGTSVIDAEVLAPAGTPKATIAYVDDMTPDLPSGSHGGSLNIAD